MDFSEELNETVIYKNGDTFTLGYSAFYASSLDCLVPLGKDIYTGSLDYLTRLGEDMFRWNINENASEFEGKTVYCLTLSEIAEQLREMKYTGMITLFVNRATSGEIYQLGKLTT